MAASNSMNEAGTGTEVVSLNLSLNSSLKRVLKPEVAFRYSEHVARTRVKLLSSFTNIPDLVA